MAKKKLFDQPQKVVNRWFAIKAIRISRPYIEDFFRYQLRFKLKFTERKRLKAIEKTMNTIVREYKKVEISNFVVFKEYLNISLFFLIAERDLQSMKIDALTHSDSWKRNLSLRVILLTLHEWDMTKVAGRKMKDIYELSGMSQELKQQLVSSLRNVNKAQKKAKKLLTHARNSTIAHRDSNAMMQYKTINSLDVNKVMKIASEFYEASHVFVNLMPKVIMASNNLESLLKQYSAKA